MKKTSIIVGARGSALSVAQTESVIRILRARHPGYTFTRQTITTRGDRSKTWLRSDTGIFVKEIEEALESGTIDIAVHSVKDLPSKIPGNLVLAAVTKREDHRDVLITRSGSDLFSLPRCCCIGTSSLRRQAQILHVRPDVRVVELRGNLDTRIRKLQSGNYDAIVVAAAGVRRLGIRAIAVRPIPETIMVPSTGQGALGIETRRNDAAMKHLVSVLDDPLSRVCVESERAFLAESNAGCRMPVACLACISGGRITLEGLIISLDGTRMIRLRGHAGLRRGKELGRRLARQVLRHGGAQILKEIRNAP